MPGLDGLRAIAVIGVIALPPRLLWIPGGLLGVGVFFTLSGYLITDILLSQVDAGRDQAEGVLARPGAAPAPGAVRDADRGHGLGDA